MKKLFGISLVAVLAVSPLMAGAADLTADQLAKANINESADSQTVATVSYVKGAYGELGTAINTKQDKITSGNKLGVALVDGAANTDLSNLTNTGKANVSAQGTVDLTGTTTYTTGTVGKALVDIKTAVDSKQAALTAGDGIIITDNGIAVNFASTSGLEAGGNGSLSVNIDNQTIQKDATFGTLKVGNIAVDNVASGSLASGSAQGALNNKLTTKDYVDETVSGAIANATSAYGNIVTHDASEFDAAGAATTAEANAKTYTDTEIQKLDADLSQTAGTDGLALSVTEVDGKITAISGSIAPNTYDAYGTAQNLVNNLGIADYAKKTGVTATITASSISGSVPVLATWGNNTATTAPITASITGAAYTEPANP